MHGAKSGSHVVVAMSVLLSLGAVLMTSCTGPDAGGGVAVLASVPHEDRVEPAKSAAFALVMLATTPAGDAYPMSEYHAMFAAAGFDGLEPLSLPDALQQALVGVRAP